MTRAIPGRFTAQTDEPFVVFLIGMRINRLRAFTKWVPTALAMAPMLSTLFRHPEKGLLGARTYISWREVMVVQYWRSFDALERFAHDDADPHRPAWRRFVKAVGYQDASVGIWHETYLIQPGACEIVYGNMPVFGLAAATQHVPAAGHLAAARRRLQSGAPPNA